MYPVIEVPSDVASHLEQLGTKGKFWFQDHKGEWTLFKEGRPGTGENWAEKVSCELAKALGLPCADFQFARHRGRPGTVSPTFVPDGGRLILGNELLAKGYRDYDKGQQFGARQHTVRAVIAVLRNVDAPWQWVAPEVRATGAEVFVGYLLLDALIGNTDRHHENWGVVSIPGSGQFLAPSFDHAASLGRNESDTARLERLGTRDRGRSAERYAERARSAFYETPADQRPLRTIEAFRAAEHLEGSAAEHWLERLGDLSMRQVDSILNNIPGDFISEPARRFARRMIEINQQRLLNPD